MPFIESADCNIYFEETGTGAETLVFVHEFSGDCRSWEPQVRHFSRRYRCITYNARGYAPSDIPEDPRSYSQDTSLEDLREVLISLDGAPCTLVGLSMGGYTALQFALRHPALVRAVAIGGVGFGSAPGRSDAWRADVSSLAEEYRADPKGAARIHARQPGRRPFMRKDPRGWAEFESQLVDLAGPGLAHTLAGVQGGRPNLYDLEDELRELAPPLLVLVGDEDVPCLEPGLFLKRTVPTCGLQVFPWSGHTLNLEEPEAFNHALQAFLIDVGSGVLPASTGADRSADQLRG